MGEAPPAAPASEAAGSARDSFWGDLTVTVAKVAVWGGCLYLLHRSGVLDFESMLDLGGSQSRKRLALKLPNRDVSHVTLTQHEAALVEDVIDPAEITDTFRDVGGLGEQVDSLNEHLLMPLRAYEAFHGHTGLATCPTGVLLHGPPGTGKTMLARAIAKEAGAVFINVRLASIQHKWYGESPKSISAIFSLARKLAPAIVFVDEIDFLLGTRENSSEQATMTVQANFLTEWDGLTSQAGAPVVVLGATNRPRSVDPAVLRRMPFAVRTPLPSSAARADILRRMLARERLAEDVTPAALAGLTAGFSGSDLRELCRAASLRRLGDAMRGGGAAGGRNIVVPNLRPLELADFAVALERSGKDAASQHRREMQQREDTGGGPDPQSALADMFARHAIAAVRAVALPHDGPAGAAAVGGVGGDPPLPAEEDA